MLSVKLLQTPSVHLDGKPIVFPYQRVDALLYYMLVCRTATRRELISLLWENYSEEVGLKNLRNTLYSLKKCLGGELLISPQKSILMLNTEWEIDCDYERFTQQNDFSAYCGNFLQGFAVKNAFTYEEWLSRTREKLHAQYLSRLAKMAYEAGESADFTKAQHLATEYLMDDPFDEEMVVFLMQQYRFALQYPKVAQVYAQLKESLETELGVTPLEQTTILYYEIMNEWNDTTAADNCGTKSLLPIGREEIYLQLRAAVNSFCDGKGKAPSQALLGESGSGKSELISHFVRETHPPELLILRGSCMMSEMSLPLMPWDTVLISVSRALREMQLSLPEHIAKQLAPYFSVFKSPSAQHTDDNAMRTCSTELTNAMLMLFSFLSRYKKLLLLLEDLQWADTDSLALLDSLVRRLEPGSLMTILTCRDFCRTEVQTFFERGSHDGIFSLHNLHPLTREHTAELLRRELGEDAAAQLTDQFFSETGGNLKLLTELTQAYRRNENITDILNSTSDILLRRVDGLGNQAIKIAYMISLFPDAAPCDILLSMVEHDSELLTNGIAELSHRGLIFETDNNAIPAYRFTQQRMRELVYSRLTVFQRQPLHLRLAQLLSSQADLSNISLCRHISYHFGQAGEPISALRFDVIAIDIETALRCESFPVLATSDQDSFSLEKLHESLVSAEQRLSALRKNNVASAALVNIEKLITLIRGRLALFEGGSDEVFSILGTLSESFLPGDEPLFLHTCRLLAAYALSQQSPDVMERYISAGMRLLERHNNPAELAMFERLKGNLFCLRCEYDKSIYYLQESIDALRTLPDRDRYRLKLAGAYCDLGRVKRQQHDYVTACSHYKKALELMGDNNNHPGAAWVYMNYGRTAFSFEDHTRARQLFRQGYEKGKITGECCGTSTCAAFCAYYAALDDDYTEAAIALSDAAEISQRADSPLEQAIFCFVRARLRLKLDREQRRGNPLDLILTDTSDSYARRGIRLLSDIPDVYEMKLLTESLHYSIINESSYRAPELYSKNRHFMTE